MDRPTPSDTSANTSSIDAKADPSGANTHNASQTLVSDPSGITLLTAQGQLLTKVIRPDNSMLPVVTPRTFSAVEFSIKHGFSGLLSELLKRPNTCAIRGGLIHGHEAANVRRLLHRDAKTGDGATVSDAPRRWIVLDVDGVQVKAGVVGLEDEAAFVRDNLLPPEFRGVRCTAVASRSYKIKSGFRAHMWFSLSEPTTCAQNAKWLRDCDRIDRALNNAIQIIYTAAPWFEGGRPDPVTKRIVELGGTQTVLVPQISATQTRRKAERRAEPASAVQKALVQVVEAMPNPLASGRTEMLAIAHAIAASLPDDVPLAKSLFVAWENRWAGQVTDGEAERVWDSIVDQEHLTGAEYVINFARRLGIDVRPYDDAVRTAEGTHGWQEFKPTEEPPTGATQADFGNSASGELPLLFRSTPYKTANEFLRQQYTMEGSRTLHRMQGTFYAWSGKHYENVADDGIRAQMYEFLNRALSRTKEGTGPFSPDRDKVNNAMDALKAWTSTSRLRRAPCWFEETTFPDARDLIAASNGLVHIPTRTIIPHSPCFFNLNALEFDFDANAPTPDKFLGFLSSLWPGDNESIGTLQEMFGLFLTTELKYQKAFLLIGPKRSGKGTIARIAGRLLGAENVSNPTLASLSRGFGLEPLIHKQLAIVGDARLGHGEGQSVTTERILSITGQDALSVDRKNKLAWNGVLGVRFLIISNELPNLTDQSGALAGRFVTLTIKQSFYGKEDLDLIDRLTPELPGILNWALDGLERLTARGKFIIPQASKEAEQELLDLGSPISAFVRDECELGAGPEYSVETDALFERWREWCGREGRTFQGTRSTFGRNLRAAYPQISKGRPRVRTEGTAPASVTGEEKEARIQVYYGIGLRAVSPGEQWAML